MANKTKPYKSVDVARYIAAYANELKVSINITKVQKLLYIAYGAYLAIKRERLVDEHPQAWPYGPVFPKTRKDFVKKTNILTLRTTDEDIKYLKEDSDIQALMRMVFKTFGEWSATALSEWSHSKGSPWHTAVYDINFSWGDVIPDTYIEPYFKSIIRNREGN